MTIRTIARAGLGALVVSVSLALVAPSAQAAPSPTPAPTTAQADSSAAAAAAASKPKYQFDVTTKGADGEKVLRAALVVKNSKNHKNRHLDWSAAKKYFDKHTTWRDDFAAGYIGGGGSLDNAAASTKTRLKKRWNDIQSGAARQSAARRGGGTNCTGVTKDVPYSRSTGRSEAWYDSCDTNFLIARYASATTILGFATARLKGWAAAIPGMFGVITTIKGANLVAAKSNSSVAAVKYVFTRVARVGGNGLVDGQVRITVSLQSQ